MTTTKNKRGGIRKNAGRPRSVRPIAATKPVWLYLDQVGSLTQSEVRQAVDEYLQRRNKETIGV